MSSECKCGLNESVCNPLTDWNYDEYWCEWKELNDWVSCTNDCKCHKSCKIGKYLNIKNCSFKKSLVNKVLFTLFYS